MRPNVRWVLPAGLLSVLLLSGCATVSEAKHKAIEPYTKEETGVKGLYRITLTDSAVKRLAVETAPVRRASAKGGAVRSVIPYAGLIYAPDGSTWTYTNPEPLLYIRVPITVANIDGDRVFLRSGPKAGTPVVIAGAAELVGIEFGLGK